MKPFRRPSLHHPLIAGLLALGWLLLRSGSRPSRLAYPCQQTAFATAALAFGAPLVTALLALRRRLATDVLRPLPLLVAATGLLVSAVVWGELSRPRPVRLPSAAVSADYRAQVFHQAGCPQDSVGDHFPCLDDLIEMMGGHGLKFYISPTTSLVAGSDGVVAADDVVVIKINYQWPERGGTNTDLLRGLIRRIVDHPDGFTGEVVVCENAQFASVEGFDRSANNAQDPTLSPHDVVAHFQALGHRVSHYDWTTIRANSVGEFSAGDMTDGYVLYPFDATMQGRVSYPKFQTLYGTRISLRDGVWDADAGYDRQRLKYINLPVLKSHHAVYGATAMVKNYMGTVTSTLGTNSHNAVRTGLMGGVIGEIRPADLNILDAVWVNANPYDGPWTTYAAATRLDRLVASRDPVAGDLWAVKHLLIPTFEANGYLPPWPEPSADPDDATSDFRIYLDASAAHIVAAGYEVTSDEARIDGIDSAPPGEVSDPRGGGAPFTVARTPTGYALSWSEPVRGGPVENYNLYRTPLRGAARIAAPACAAALGPGTSTELSTLDDDHGFLVVGRNAVGDGSFGRDAAGHERPAPLEGVVCP